MHTPSFGQDLFIVLAGVFPVFKKRSAPKTLVAQEAALRTKPGTLNWVSENIRHYRFLLPPACLAGFLELPTFRLEKKKTVARRCCPEAGGIL